MLRLAPASPTLSELVSLSHSICKNKDLLPSRLRQSCVDNNPMSGRYEDYPVYSLFTQGNQWKAQISFHWGCQIVLGLLLAKAWKANTPWHPVSPDVVKFVNELRIIMRDRLSNKILSLVGDAHSFQGIIDSLASESQSNIITSKIIDLTIRIQEVLSHELDSQQPKATSNPNTNSATLVPELDRHVNTRPSKPENPLPAQPIHTQSPKQHSSVVTQPPSRLDEIEKIILGDNPSADEVSTAKTFREILSVISFCDRPVDKLDIVLQAIEPLLPIAEALCPRFSDIWPRWAATICKVLDILRNLFGSSPLLPQEKYWRSKLGEHPLISCLVTEIDKAAPSGLLPAKAILLSGYYAIYEELDLHFAERFTFFVGEKILANTIRKCCTLKWTHLQLAQMYLPEWPISSPEKWKELFFEKANETPPTNPYLRYPDKHSFIHTIQLILEYTNQNQKNTPRHEHTVTKLPLQEQDHSVVIQPATNNYSRSGRKHSVRPSFNLFPKQRAHVDADSDGLAPDMIHIIPLQDTPVDQPVQLAAVQSLEVRYTNYRTAMDNQRLPWAWDCLNKFEIVALRHALKDSATLENASVSEKQGAFLVWLMLAIGQSIDQILQLCLTHSANIRGALIFGPVYRKYIQSPPHAFRPSEQEKILLGNHGQFIDLSLAPPFPALFGELGLIDSNVKPNLQYKNIGAYLKLDNAGADKVVRQFLEQHRTRDMRLLPGKIRNVLSAEIMRVAQDPVATHLLSSLPTDMPPAGVYYTSYSEDVLRQIYDQATTRILGKES